MAAHGVGLPAGVKWRLATLEDYNDIMDINRNIYDGMDHLPHKYSQYIRDPNRICSLLLKAGKVVRSF